MGIVGKDLRPGNVSIHRVLARLVHFVPEGEFDPVPKAKFVVDNAKVVLDDMLCGADGFSDFAVLEPLRDQFDNSKFSFVGSARSVPISSEHSCLP